MGDEVLHVFHVNKLHGFKQTATLHHLRVLIKNQFRFPELPAFDFLFTQDDSSISIEQEKRSSPVFFFFPFVGINNFHASFNNEFFFSVFRF